MDDNAFWLALDELVATSRIEIDRPAGTRHPKYPDFLYPLDYGYLCGTMAMDGGGIDVWRGSLPGAAVDAVICTVDLFKRDAEIKLLIGCTEAEMQAALATHNGHASMKGMLVRRNGVR